MEVKKKCVSLQDMTQFTMEALVNANSFTNEEISTIMGIEDNFLIRVGDNGHDKNGSMWGTELLLTARKQTREAAYM